MKFSTFILFAILFFACGKTEKATEQPPTENTAQGTEPQLEDNTTAPTTTETKIEEEEVVGQEVAVPPVFEKKLTDGKITFDIKCENGEQSKFTITGSGFNKDIKFGETIEGQLTGAHLLDLDKDGFSEIYLVFNQTDDSGNKMIKAYSSYRNRSAGEIYVKDTDMVRTVNSDQVYVDGKKLMRSFKDENGKEIKFNYQLGKGESSFVLTPERM